MPMEIHGLGSTRWTSTVTATGGRAPFGGRSFGGLGGCGCPGPRCGRGCGCVRCAQPALAGFGAVSPIARNLKPGDTPELTVRSYVTSAGEWAPTRMISALSGVLSAQGVRMAKPKVGTYPLVWAWQYDGPNKLYQAYIVGDRSGPFKRVLQGEGAMTTSAPTAADAQSLPSVGSVISFDRMQMPSKLDLNVLLGELRNAKTVAARGSNATGGGQLELLVTPKPKSGGMGWLAVVALGALVASNQGA